MLSIIPSSIRNRSYLRVTSLEVRLKVLLSFVRSDMIRIGPRGPLLISDDWLREATRVYRRVLSNGGTDLSLLEATICCEPDESLNTSTAEWRRAFMLEDDGFKWLMRRSPSSSRPSNDTPLHDTIKSFKDEAPGSWRRFV